MSKPTYGQHDWVPPAYDESDWHYLDPGALIGWEAWSVGVKIQSLPDGQLIITGVRIEPFDEHDGKIRDQQLTSAKLRTLPLRILLAQASLQSAILDADMSGIQSKVLEKLRATQQYEIDHAFEENKKEIGPKKAQLQRIASLYHHALNWPGWGGPRDQIAKALGISKVTVDRQLQESRKQGFLPAFEGKQAKHGQKGTEGK